MIISGTENVTDVLFGQETVSDVYFGDDLKYTAFKEIPTVLSFKYNDTTGYLNSDTMNIYKEDETPTYVYVNDELQATLITSGTQDVVLDLSIHSTNPDGYKVSITGGEWYFDESCSVNNVSLLEDVVFGTSYGTIIGERCFMDAVNLRSEIIIPDSVVSIKLSAFLRCCLSSVIIPKSVVEMCSRAFEDCDYLTEVKYLGSIDDWVSIYFESSMNANPLTGGAILKINNESVTEAHITKATTINGLSFYGYGYLTTLIIGDSVNTIGSSAFSNCTGLTNITIPDSVNNINNYAFSGCTGLTGELIIPKGITSVSNGVFKDCTGFSGSLVIPSHITVIGDYAFYGCTGLTSLFLPESIEQIGVYAFAYCYGVQSLQYNANITTDFDDYSNVFSGLGMNATSCELIIGDSVTNIPAFTFTGGKIGTANSWTYAPSLRLTSINIPHSVVSIGLHAFSDMEYVSLFYYNGAVPLNHSLGNVFGEPGTSVTNCEFIIGDDVTDIPNSFYSGSSGNYYGQKGPTSISISENVKNIGSSAFVSCGRLKTLTIPSNVTTLGQYAFAYNYNIEKLYYNANVTTVPTTDSLIFRGIGKQASSCDVVVGAGVTTIPEYLFYATDSNLNGITSVTFSNTVETISRAAFYKCTRLHTVTIPSSVKTLGVNCFNRCSNLTTVNFESSPETISNYAFYGANLSVPTEKMYNATTLGVGCFAFKNPWTLTTTNKTLATKLVGTNYSSSDTTIGYGGTYCAGMAGMASTQSGGTDSVSGTINTVRATIDGTTYPVSGSWTFGQSYKFSTITYVVMTRASAPSISMSFSSNLSNWGSDVTYCNTAIAVYSNNATTATAGSVLEVYCNCAVEGTCIVKGTLITLANGTYKPVENITYSDLLKVYNFETGTYDYQYPSLLAHSTTKWITKIILEDDSFIKISGVHDIYDPIRHEFVAWGNGNVKLEDATKYHMYKDVNNELKILSVKDIEWINEETDVYCCMTGGTLTAFANDLLIGSVLLNFAGISDNDKFYDRFQLDKEDAVSYDYFTENIYNESSKYIILGLNLQYLQFYYDPEKTNYSDLLYPFTHFLTEPEQLNGKIVCRIGLMENGKLTENDYYEDSEIVLPEITEPGKSKWYAVGEYRYLNPGDKFKVNFSTIIRAV